jgi:hypothetical protein
MRHAAYLVLMLSAYACASSNYVVHAQAMPGIQTTTENVTGRMKTSHLWAVQNQPL